MWPLEETMYLPEWATNAYQAPSGSLYSHLIEDETHNFDAEKQHDYPASLRRTKMWPNPHPMVADGSRCTLCQNPFGPKGCFTVGSCGAQFHPPCLISYMIKKRSCPHCRSSFHSRLYLQFRLLKYMPSNWVCDPKDFPFPLGEWSGAEMEWSWRHQRSKVENLHREEDGEWITDPTQVLYVANELYPEKPNTHGLKGFFFQTLNWHWHEPSQTLRQGIHPPFYASSGKPARSTASIQQDVAHLPHLGNSSEAEELYWEEMYHRRRLMYQTIDAILNRIGPEVMRWLEGGSKPTRKIAVSLSNRPRT